MANIGVEIDLGDDSDDDVLGLEEDENAASKMRIQFSDIDLNNTVPSAMVSQHNQCHQCLQDHIILLISSKSSPPFFDFCSMSPAPPTVS